MSDSRTDARPDEWDCSLDVQEPIHLLETNQAMQRIVCHRLP
jgi:hypothetical protein